MKEMKRQKVRGFTLIELVATIILLGVLSVSAVSIFSGRDSYDEYAVRDQIISGLRLAQQYAMSDHAANECFRLSVNSGKISPQRYNGTTYSPIGISQKWRDGIVIEGATVADLDGDGFIYFDGVGRPLDNTANCMGAVAQAHIDITGSTSLGVRIHETGYIQALP